MSRGAEWAKWDLHVHTPSSLVQGYGADNDETWEKFFLDLEGLPSEFTVIGINDYWFLDGYRKVLAAKAAGRMQNISCIVPIIELRLNQFGGSVNKLSRANLHVIFDPGISADVIQAQFVNALSSEFTVLPDEGGKGRWSGVPTRESLTDLGRLIKESVPPAKIGAYGPDLIEGFNNLVVPLDSVVQLLQGPYFEGRTLMALGKVEWADIKWQEASVASKKNLINKVDMLFTAYEDVSRWRDNCAALKADNVLYKVLDCSDAHSFSNSTAENNRIGRCATWLRAEPSFNGLVHALSEFDDRAFVGAEPPDIARRRTNPESIIDWVSVRPVADDAKKPLFDYELELNHGLVAIVGNKGQGKSALLDCIARAANSSRNKDFGFLNPTRFLHPRNGSKNRYEATVSWVSGRSQFRNLAASHDPAEAESIEYLPQMLIERICASNPLSQEHEDFQKELRKVLFHHLPFADREHQNTLEDLIELRTAPIGTLLNELQGRTLKECNLWAELHRLQATTTIGELKNKELELMRSIEVAETDLRDAREELKSATSSGADSTPENLQNNREEMARLEVEINQASQRRGEDLRVLGELRRRTSVLQDISSEISLVVDRTKELDQRLRAEFPEIESGREVISLVAESGAIDALKGNLSTQAEALEAKSQAAQKTIAELAVRRDEIRVWLEAEDSAREGRRRAVEQLEKRVQSLNGSEDSAGTLENIRAQIARFERLPDDIDKIKGFILANVRQAYQYLTIRRDLTADLYKPATEFITGDPLAQQVGLEFQSELTLDSSWHEIAERLDGRKNVELINVLNSFDEIVDINDVDQVVAYVDDLLSRLAHERGDVRQPARSPHAAVRNNVSLADLVWQISKLGWITTTFALTGHGSPLETLSPGERGLILLLFYLIVDQNRTPLLLDQPEENLDNRAVRQVLVPALKRAKRQRQIILVTHNANLAIVGDADQIVYCEQIDGQFSIHAGPLSDATAGENALDVLEGTRPAFLVRENKYSNVIPRESQR
ncbi:TrlF family AAA-like ATPase [Amycolatopsis sp. NPDC023774]|uniref:TrlF family AAA-like ATPase n=1 Tax=Amycolatopsis sp. NPDC023774 TaxID=3155015 RepID=UPI0033D0BB0F